MKLTLLIAFVCALPLVTHAQERPVPGKSDIVMVDLSDVPLKDALKFYQRLSGKPVLAHIDLDLEIWVNIVKEGQMTFAEAKALIRDELLKQHLELREADSGETLVTRVVEPKLGTRSNGRK